MGFRSSYSSLIFSEVILEFHESNEGKEEIQHETLFFGDMVVDPTMHIVMIDNPSFLLCLPSSKLKLDFSVFANQTLT